MLITRSEEERAGMYERMRNEMELEHEQLQNMREAGLGEAELKRFHSRETCTRRAVTGNATEKRGTYEDDEKVVRNDRQTPKGENGAS